MSRLRLLEKDRPGFGPLVAHSAKNDAYPYLAQSQNEALRAHIWGQARAKRFVTIFGAKFTPPGASKSAVNAASSVVVVVVVVVGDVKILTIK